MAASHRREGEAQHRHPRESRPSKYAAVVVRQDWNETRDSSRRTGGSGVDVELDFS